LLAYLIHDTNSNFFADIQPTTPTPPCLSSLQDIPTLYLDSHDVVGCATVNTLNKIKGYHVGTEIVTELQLVEPVNKSEINQQHDKIDI